tara:strand:- start:444 stop:566 length:123 start_codon:yes stop_codon:yes gene_type:complete
MSKLFEAFQLWKKICKDLHDYDEYALSYPAYDYDEDYKDI